MDGAPYNKEQVQIDAEKVIAEVERLQKYMQKFKKTFSALFYENINNDDSVQTDEKCSDRSIIHTNTNTIYNIPDGSNLHQIDKMEKTNKNDKYVENVKILTTKYFHTLSSFEYNRLFENQTLKEAANVYGKLISLGYSDKLIEQAVQDARNDAFWTVQFRSLRKLVRKNKDGVLYIDVFLALKQHKHKLTIPKIIR